MKKWPRPPSVPVVQLRGYWLNQVGFEVGKQLEVLPGIDHLVITLAPDKKP
ncbi:MAG: type I addiction module toxin, SymE family [Gammaproteobacteria bacterium]|nr:type I addiction module toxin, SymE family [Gammaproteobacteria bacterium]